MIPATATLRKTKAPVPPDTSAAAADENAAERLAHDLGVGDNETTVTIAGSPGLPATGSTGGDAVTVTRNGNGGGFLGEFDAKDFKIPQFKIVNGSGPLSQKYNQGAVLYADELLWKTPELTAGAINPSLKFVPVLIQKQWRETLTQDEVAQEIMPRTVNTVAEAMRIGGGIEWGKDGSKPRWQPSGRCILLLQEPETCTHSGFTYELDGKRYAPAVYYCSGMGYREFVTVIHSRVALNNGVIDKNFWQFSVGRKQAGNFGVWVPAIKMLREDVGEQARAMASRLNGVPTQVVEAE